MMSPHEMKKYLKDFKAACRRFGWKRKKKITDEGFGWKNWVEVVYWVDKNEKYLFAETDLQEAMVKELIRIGESFG